MPINEAEKKLAQYRAKKEREALINEYKAKVKSMISGYFQKDNQKNEYRKPETEQKEILLTPQSPSIYLSNSDEEDVSSEIEENSSLTKLDYILYCLYFILWATIYAIFIKLQFGTVYFILSMLVGIYLNTRTRPRKKNEPSAYSVFNKNCEKIDGTLDGEQMTNQMLYGAFSR